MKVADKTYDLEKCLLFGISQVSGYARASQIEKNIYFNSSFDSQHCIHSVYKHTTHLDAQSRIQVSENRLYGMISGFLRSLTQEQHSLETNSVLYWSALPRCPKYPTNTQITAFFCLLVAECSLYRHPEVSYHSKMSLCRSPINPLSHMTALSRYLGYSRASRM